MKTIRLSIIAIAAVLASAAVAFAAPATTTSNVNMRSGPSTGAPVIDVLRTGTPVDAQCNNSGWCQVYANGQSGWVSSSFIALSVGNNPRPPTQPPVIRPPVIQPPIIQPPVIQPPRPGNPGGGLFPPRPGNPGPFPPRPPIQPPRPPIQPPVYEQSGACFYAERDFRGPSFCVDRGETLDRLPRNWDDAIRSVEVFRGARVDICSDRDQYGACTTLRSDARRLPNGLDRRASSVSVY